MRNKSLFLDFKILITVLVTAVILIGGIASAVIMSYSGVNPFIITLILISDAVLSLILPILILMNSLRKLTITVLIGYIVIACLVCGIYAVLV